MSCHVSKWATIIHMKPHSSIWTPHLQWVFTSPNELPHINLSHHISTAPPQSHLLWASTHPLSHLFIWSIMSLMSFLISSELPYLQAATYLQEATLSAMSLLISNELPYLQWATLSSMSFLISGELPYLQRATSSPMSVLISNELPHLQWASLSPVSYFKSVLILCERPKRFLISSELAVLHEVIPGVDLH